MAVRLLRKMKKGGGLFFRLLNPIRAARMCSNWQPFEQQRFPIQSIMALAIVMCTDDDVFFFFFFCFVIPSEWKVPISKYCRFLLLFAIQQQQRRRRFLISLKRLFVVLLLLAGEYKTTGQVDCLPRLLAAALLTRNELPRVTL